MIFISLSHMFSTKAFDHHHKNNLHDNNEKYRCNICGLGGIITNKSPDLLFLVWMKPGEFLLPGQAHPGSLVEKF